MRHLILLTAFALPLTAQQPQVQNGQLAAATEANLQSAVSAAIAQNTTTWIAYTVPTTTRIQQNWGADGVTYLEDEHRAYSEHRSNEAGAPQYRALILLRVANHAVTHVRVENPDRKLDAGGTRVQYLATVDPAQSVALLQSLAEKSTTDRLRDSSVFALSTHQSPATVPALVALAAPEHDLRIREKAAFWLSTQHGHDALPILERWAREDRDDNFRDKLTFDLTLIHEPAASDVLIRMAHQDPAPRVRKQAQFWMATLGGKRVAADLNEAANSDPNVENRKSAVFALSQMPNGEGTPRLIDLAQTSKDPAVRKQAIFWLGQSNDPRALDYLTRLIRQ